MKLDKRTLLAIVYLIVVLILVFTAPACTQKEVAKCDESEFHDARFEYLNRIAKLKEERDDALLLLGSTAGACFIKEYENDTRYYKLGVVEDRVIIMKRFEVQTIDDMKTLSAWKQTDEVTTSYLIQFERIDCKQVPK